MDGSSYALGILFVQFLVDAASHGRRIDSFLERQLRNYTSWKLQRMIREGAARIDEALAEQTDRVFVGQLVRIQLLEPPDKLLDPEPIEVPVLYADAWMLVVNKPAGLIAHPTGEIQQHTLANALQWWLDEHSPARGLLRPGIVHRLDRQTSGLMAVALTHQAHAQLSSAFESSRVSKTYVALLRGKLKESDGVINLPIGRSPIGRHTLMSCLADARDRKPARTRFEVVRRYREYTLVRCRPLSGRNHQIRVHFAHIGHPLVGDEFYAPFGKYLPFYEEQVDTREAPREIETGLPIRRHALHAEQLALAHPISDLWMRFHAPLPNDFQQTLDVLANQLIRQQ